MIRFIKNLLRRVFGLPVPRPIDVVHQAPFSTDESIGNPGFYVGKVVNGSSFEIDLVTEAVEILNKAVLTEKFKQLTLAWNFDRDYTKGLTNEQILFLIIRKHHLANVSWFTGSWRQNHVWHTVGYDNEDEYVHVNRYFVNEPYELASLILHETMHSLGFSHASASHRKSVPYSMNDIFEATVEAAKL